MPVSFCGLLRYVILPPSSGHGTMILISTGERTVSSEPPGKAQSDGKQVQLERAG